MYSIMKYHSLIKRNEVLMCYDTGDPWKHYAKWERPDTKGHIQFQSHKMFRIGKSIVTEIELVVAWGWVGRVKGDW